MYCHRVDIPLVGHCDSLCSLGFASNNKSSFPSSPRLSYRQRIAEVVPEQFDCFVPLKPEPVYKFANDTAGELLGRW